LLPNKNYSEDKEKVKKIRFFSLFGLQMAQKYLKLHQQQTIISVILAILLLRVFFYEEK
jgi:hypothetical protein